MSGITAVGRIQANNVSQVTMTSTDDLATCAGAAYLTAQIPNLTIANQGVFEWLSDDMVLLSASDGDGWFTLSDDLSTLELYSTAGNGAVTLPVVSGDFTVFDGTLGALKDNGNAPSSPTADLFVAMSPGSMTANNILAANDANGTLKDTGILYNTVAISTITSPDPQSDTIWHDVVCGEAALASGGSVTIQASSGSKQYVVRDIRVNYGASGLSGNSGNRLLEVTDGTNVFNASGITAALLGTPVNTVWGGTGNPLPSTLAMDTPSVAGAAIVAKYAGGTTDYNAGSVTLSVLVQRVA